MEGDKLREQLQSFITQYEARDKHFETQIQAKELEKQIAEEKQAQATLTQPNVLLTVPKLSDEPVHAITICSKSALHRHWRMRPRNVNQL
jgi:TPP-dependent trihydroxycyclohexane-1,2-dione (THcHDO) dehydratase